MQPTKLQLHELYTVGSIVPSCANKVVRVIDRPVCHMHYCEQMHEVHPCTDPHTTLQDLNVTLNSCRKPVGHGSTNIAHSFRPYSRESCGITQPSPLSTSDEVLILLFLFFYLRLLFLCMCVCDPAFLTSLQIYTLSCNAFFLYNHNKFHIITYSSYRHSLYGHHLCFTP